MDYRSRFRFIDYMKFKGNQKQLEHITQLDGVFDKIKSEITPDNEAVVQLVDEGKKIIRKRQKCIEIAEKSVDGMDGKSYTNIYPMNWLQFLR